MPVNGGQDGSQAPGDPSLQNAGSSFQWWSSHSELHNDSQLGQDSQALYFALQVPGSSSSANKAGGTATTQTMAKMRNAEFLIIRAMDSDTSDFRTIVPPLRLARATGRNQSPQPHSRLWPRFVPGLCGASSMSRGVSMPINVSVVCEPRSQVIPDHARGPCQSQSAGCQPEQRTNF
jgi:hypothetical protein